MPRVDSQQQSAKYHSRKAVLLALRPICRRSKRRGVQTSIAAVTLPSDRRTWRVRIHGHSLFPGRSAHEDYCCTLIRSSRNRCRTSVQTFRLTFKMLSTVVWQNGARPTAKRRVAGNCLGLLLHRRRMDHHEAAAWWATCAEDSPCVEPTGHYVCQKSTAAQEWFKGRILPVLYTLNSWAAPEIRIQPSHHVRPENVRLCAQCPAASRRRGYLHLSSWQERSPSLRPGTRLGRGAQIIFSPRTIVFPSVFSFHLRRSFGEFAHRPC